VSTHKHSKEYLKKWRQSESGKKCIGEYRENSKEKRKLWAKKYYLEHRDEILKRTSEYNKSHPDVIKKSQNKNRGKNIIRGRKDREDLKAHYLNSLIRNYDTNLSIEERQSSILIRRIKQKINSFGFYKVCSQCFKNLPIDAYNKVGKTVKGEIRYNNFCKKCYSERRKKYNLNLDKIKASNKKYWQNKKLRLKNEQHNNA
jgi:hypothetical protein